jgi:hypothetical protein
MKSLEPESTLQKQFRQVHDQLVTIAREFSGMESANDRLISNNIARRIDLPPIVVPFIELVPGHGLGSPFKKGWSVA